MSDKKFDMDLMLLIGSQMASISQVFTTSEELAESADAALGGQAAATELRKFSYSWHDHRTQIVECIDHLSETTTRVVEEFRTFDRTASAEVAGSHVN